MCGFIVTAQYFSNLDANLMRLDHLERFELNKGTVDFVATEEYWVQNPPKGLSATYIPAVEAPNGSRPPLPMNYVFAIDVSHDAVAAGFLQSACDVIRRVLFGGEDPSGRILEPCFPPASQLAIITFDQSVHFHVFSVNLSHRWVFGCDVLIVVLSQSDSVSVLVVPDIEEVFAPTLDRLFVDPVESR